MVHTCTWSSQAAPTGVITVLLQGRADKRPKASWKNWICPTSQLERPLRRLQESYIWPTRTTRTKILNWKLRGLVKVKPTAYTSLCRRSYSTRLSNMPRKRAKKARAATMKCKIKF
ncbi:uncharacterized protein OGAPODRAFT_96254 [Ogataea polymorpha]|uniref:uncharacterized protein n=1 Tax=Ogataea polymorpha TaxID=460523 RepID=UPI0007F36D3B|nr:uncharacterized protein OGAPODRAFT_96254 [Ogataea polymorpha]OBA18151.1 hypothetical protein OGAPODRAFT_96254 [Ogataea polymorpha]